MESDKQISDQGNLDLSVAGADDDTHINALEVQNTSSNSKPGEVVVAAQKASSEISSPTAAAKPNEDNLETGFLKVIIHGSFFHEKRFLPRVEPGLTCQVHN